MNIYHPIPVHHLRNRLKKTCVVVRGTRLLPEQKPGVLRVHEVVKLANAHIPSQLQPLEQCCELGMKDGGDPDGAHKPCHPLTI